MSTPRVLLGRSLTCPSEASTEKPFPRYFWIVFALAGDSTMTKPFDNGSSVLVRFDLKLARMGMGQQVTGKAASFEPRASSLISRSLGCPNTLNQRREHSLQFIRLSAEDSK